MFTPMMLASKTFTPRGVDFDGSTTYLTRGAGLTGAADSKSGLFSYWVRLDSGTGLQRILGASTSLAGAANRWRSSRASASGALQVIGDDTSGNSDLVLQSNDTFAADPAWIHFLSSWDVAAAAGSIYVNDALDLDSGPTLTDDTLDYTTADWGVAADPDGTDKLNGCLAELYFFPGVYLDLSQEANRRKFISAEGLPVNLGASGQLVTGTSPLVYLSLRPGEAATAFATNRGTGGNFSVTGTLAIASTGPSD